MPPAFTSPQPTCGCLPARPSQLLPDAAGEQVRPGPRPHYLRAPTLLRPGLTLNWLLKTILLSSWKSQSFLGPSRGAPHGSSRSAHRATRRLITRFFSVSPKLRTSSQSFSCFPNSLSPFVTGSLTLLTAPTGHTHVSTRLLTHPHTTPHTAPLITHHHAHTPHTPHTISHTFSSPHTTPHTAPLITHHRLHAHAPHTPHSISHTSSHISSAPQHPHESSQFCTQSLRATHTLVRSPPRRPSRCPQRRATGLPGSPGAPRPLPRLRTPLCTQRVLISSLARALRGSQSRSPAAPAEPRLHTCPHTAPHTVPALHTIPTPSTHTVSVSTQLLTTPQSPSVSAQGHVCLPGTACAHPRLLSSRVCVASHSSSGQQLPRASLGSSQSHFPLALTPSQGSSQPLLGRLPRHAPPPRLLTHIHTAPTRWARSSQMLVWPLSCLLTSPKPVPSPHTNQALPAPPQDSGPHSCTAAPPARSAPPRPPGPDPGPPLP